MAHSSRHFSTIAPGRIKFKRELSKSDRVLLKCIDEQTQWNMIVELSPMEIIFEQLNGDGTLGLFGITDPRRANYTATLKCTDDDMIVFLESVFAAFTAFLLQSTLQSTPTGECELSLPLSNDSRVTQLKVKRRLCKWAKDGVEPERNPPNIVQWDGTTHNKVDTILERGDIIQPIVKISPWTVSGVSGISLEIVSIQLISKVTRGTEFSIPDLPPLKRQRTEVSTQVSTQVAESRKSPK